MHIAKIRNRCLQSLAFGCVAWGLWTGVTMAQTGVESEGAPASAPSSRLLPFRPVEGFRRPNMLPTAAAPNPPRVNSTTQQPTNPTVRRSQTGPIPSAAPNRARFQQVAGQPNNSGKSDIQQQLDDLYRSRGQDAPEMNMHALPSSDPNQQQYDDGQGGQPAAQPGYNGQSPQGGSGNRAMPNTPVRGNPSGNANAPQQEYKEPNLLKRWFGPRKKSGEGSAHPQQPPQSRSMFRPSSSQSGAGASQNRSTNNGAGQPRPRVATVPAQNQNPPAEPTPPAPEAGRSTLNYSNLARERQNVAQPPAAAGNSSVTFENQTAPQGTPNPQGNPTEQEPEEALSQIQNPQGGQGGGATQPQQNQPQQSQPGATPSEQPADQTPRLDHPLAEPSATEQPVAPKSQPRQSPFNNLEVFTPEDGQQPTQQQPAAQQQTPAQEGAVEQPQAPPGKTSMTELQQRAQRGVLMLEGEDDEQREKYRILAAFPEKTGFKGFCPTVLRDERELVRGRKAHQMQHHDQVYLFSSAKALATCQTSPDRYLPIADGKDVVALKSSQEVPGSLDFAAWYRGRLYMFSSRQNLEAFATDPMKFATASVQVVVPSVLPTKTPDNSEEMNDADEEEDLELEEKSGGAPATQGNGSPASKFQGTSPMLPTSPAGTGNPVPRPPPESDEAEHSDEEPEMPGKKLRAAKISSSEESGNRKRVILRVAVPSK